MPRRTLHAQLLYLWMLLKRFRFTFFMLFVLVGGGGRALYFLCERAGRPISLLRAIVTAYSLLFAQPIADLPDNGPIELVAEIIPPLGIVTVAEGMVRFAVLLFSKSRNAKEWFAVLAQTIKDHVIVCGAGRVRIRVFTQHHQPGIPLVVCDPHRPRP